MGLGMEQKFGVPYFTKTYNNYWMRTRGWVWYEELSSQTFVLFIVFIIYLKDELDHLCVQFVEIMTSSFSQIFPFFFFHKYFKMFQNLSWLFSIRSDIFEVVSFTYAIRWNRVSIAWRHNVEYDFVIFNVMTLLRWILCRNCKFGQLLSW